MKEYYFRKLSFFIKVKVIIHIDGEISNIKKEIERKVNETNKILGTYVNYTTKKI